MVWVSISPPAILIAHDWGSGEGAAALGPLHAQTEDSGLLTQHEIPKEESGAASNSGGLHRNCHGLVSQVSDVGSQHLMSFRTLPCDGPNTTWLSMATGDLLPSPEPTSLMGPMMLLDQQPHLFLELSVALYCHLSPLFTP